MCIRDRYLVGRHLGFLKSRNFIGYWRGECREASACQTSGIVEFTEFYWLTLAGGPRRITTKFCQNWSFRCRDIAFFRIFKMAAAAILDFWNREILLVIVVQRVETHQHAKFRQNRSIGCEDIKIFFYFSRWRPPQSRIFKFVKFYWLTVSWGPRHITIPNFLEISHSIAEILRSFEFSSWPPPPSWIFEIDTFYWLLGSRGSRRIFVPNIVKIGQSVAKILRFFDFSRWRPSAILDSFGAHSEYPQWVLAGLYHYAKFGYDRCSSCYNMNISIFDTFGWRMLIHAPKIGVFWQFDPQNGVQYQRKPKKANPCVSPRHLKY